MKKYAYSIPVLGSRLIKKAKPIAKYLTISTLASLIGNLSHMGVMGFGALSSAAKIYSVNKPLTTCDTTVAIASALNGVIMVLLVGFGAYFFNKTIQPWMLVYGGQDFSLFGIIEGIIARLIP